jgi:hypothetical protein
MSALLCLALLLQTPRDATPQRTAAAGTSIIGGVVTTGLAKKPVPRALVSIAGTEINGVHQVVTDDTGHFVFDRLRPGRFTLVAEKPGYLKTFVGSRQPGRPPATPIAVMDGQRMTDIAIDMPRGGVIAGVVRDEDGRPIASSQVMAQLMTYSMGVRTFVNASAGPRAGWVVTNDRGEYRIWGLPPGEYTVRASGNGLGASMLTAAEYKAAEDQVQTGRVPPPGAVPSTRQQRGIVYYPGVADVVLAQTIALALSEERTGVDLVNAPVSSFNIEYAGIGPGGRPIAQAVVGIASVSRQSLFTSLGGVHFDADGHGIIRGVPPGRYLLFGRGAESTEPAAPQYWLQAEVDVNGVDATGVVLQFLPGQRVSGKLQTSGSPLPAVTASARVQLNPAPLISGTGSTTPTAAITSDGTFTFANVPPGRYRLEMGGVPGWNPIAAISGGVDTLDEPLDVRPSLDVDGLTVSVTDTLTEIGGLVTDGAGRPTPELSVLVFSQQRNLWSSPRRFSGPARISTDGRYHIVGLPPGDYLLAVVNDLEPRQATDPVILEQLMTGAIAIHLAEGQKVVQDLKVGG